MDQEIHCPGGTKSQSGVAVKERYPNAKISSCGKITDVITRLEIESETYVIPIWNSHAGEVLAADYVWDLIEDHKIQILDIWAKPIHFCFLKKMDTTVIHGKI